MAVEQFAGIRGNPVSAGGEPTAQSGAHPSMLRSAQGAGPGVPSLLLLLTHRHKENTNKCGDRRSSRSNSPAQGTVHSSGSPATSPSLSKAQGFPGALPCHAPLPRCPQGELPAGGLPPFQWAGPAISVSLFGLCVKPPKLMNVLFRF